MGSKHCVVHQFSEIFSDYLLFPRFIVIVIIVTFVVIFEFVNETVLIFKQKVCHSLNAGSYINDLWAYGLVVRQSGV